MFNHATDPRLRRHNFKKNNFNHPTWCVFSNAFIWGLDKSGYSCTACLLVVGRQHIAQAKKTVCIPVRNRVDEVVSTVDTAALAKTRVFTVYLDHGYKKAVLLNPIEPLRVVLEKICISRGITMDEYTPEDMNGVELPINTLLGSIKGSEITFTSKGKQVSRTPPLLADVERELNMAKKTEDEGRRQRTSVMDLYEMECVLGNGAFSVVQKARQKETKEYVAIKILEKADAEDLEEQTEKIKSEVNLMKQLHHPYIIQFFHMEEDEEHFFVVLELVTGNELFDQVVEKQCYTEKEAAPLLAQTLSAIAYMHSQGIVHRDIKPENLLFKDKTYQEVKLADFGEAKIYTGGCGTYSGTPDYMAPEIIKVLHGTGADGDPVYDQSCDLWSFGCVAFVMMGGYPPFEGKTEDEVIKSILNCKYGFPSPEWDHIGDLGKDFIRRLFVLKPEDRMTALQALSHAFITTYVEHDTLHRLVKAARTKGPKPYSRKNSSSSSEKEKKSQIRPRKPSDPPLLSRLLHTANKDEGSSGMTSGAGSDAIEFNKGTPKSLSSDKLKNAKVSPGKDSDKDKVKDAASGAKFIFSTSLNELKSSRRQSSGASRDSQVTSTNSTPTLSNNTNTSTSSNVSATNSHPMLVVDTTRAIEIDLKDCEPGSKFEEADVTGMVAETNHLLDDILGSLTPSELSNSTGLSRDKVKKEKSVGVSSRHRRGTVDGVVTIVEPTSNHGGSPPSSVASSDGVSTMKEKSRGRSGSKARRDSKPDEDKGSEPAKPFVADAYEDSFFNSGSAASSDPEHGEQKKFKKRSSQGPNSSRTHKMGIALPNAISSGGERSELTKSNERDGSHSPSGGTTPITSERKTVVIKEPKK